MFAKFRQVCLPSHRIVTRMQHLDPLTPEYPRRYAQIVNVEVTPLPGIGVRKDFESGSGRRIGVVVRRDGSTDLIASRADDPDTCELQVALSQDEAAVLGNLLGTPQLMAQLQE